MLLLVSIILVVQLLLSCPKNFENGFASASEEIGYGLQPELGLCHYGRRQSPINIVERDAEDMPATVNFTFANYVGQSVYNMKDVNTWLARNTLTLFADSSQQLHVILNVVNESSVYIFHSVHFHVGCTEHSFSEELFHTMHGFKAVQSVELHFVHFNQAFGSFEEALSERNGLFVYAIIIRSFPGSAKNQPLQEFLNFLEKPRDGDPLAGPSTWFDILFNGTSRNGFVYVYNGSMARYPCLETVIWGVNPDWQNMSSSQHQQFLDQFHNHRKVKMRDNCRPQKNMYGRKLFRINYEVRQDYHPIPPRPPPPTPAPRPYRPGEGELGERLPPLWLLYLIPAFIIGGLTYMHRHYDWSFLDELYDVS